MSLRHAILVLLESEGGTGYDIVKSFNQGLGFFWNATHQQVYKELKKLNADRLLECKIEERVGRPDKKYYVLTQAGRDHLKSWLAEPVKIPRINDALLVKMYAGDLNDYHQLGEEIESQRQRYQQLLASFLALDTQYQQASVEERERMRMPYLTLKRGIYGVEAWLRWAEEVQPELAAKS